MQILIITAVAFIAIIGLIGYIHILREELKDTEASLSLQKEKSERLQSVMYDCFDICTRMASLLPISEEAEKLTIEVIGLAEIYCKYDERQFQRHLSFWNCFNENDQKDPLVRAVVDAADIHTKLEALRALLFQSLNVNHRPVRTVHSL